MPITLSHHRGRPTVILWTRAGQPWSSPGGLEREPLLALMQSTRLQVGWLVVCAHYTRSNPPTPSLPYPVLLDPTGRVGQLYGGTHRPRVCLVSPEGRVVHREFEGPLDPGAEARLSWMSDLLDEMLMHSARQQSQGEQG